MARIHTCLLLMLSLLLGCDVPVAGNEKTPAPSTWIGGTLRLDDGSAEPGGPAFLFRFACDDPPPPAGSGLPQDFVVVPEESFDGASAPFVFPLVPADACYLLGGFVDRDRDFHYAYSATSQATAGDLAVAATQVEVGQLAGDWIEPVTGMILRANTLVEIERPAFRTIGLSSGVAEVPGLSLDPAGSPIGDALFGLESRDVESDLVDVTAPFFTVVFAPDGDGDGLPDDLNGDGIPEILWPRIAIRRLEPTDPQALTLSDPTVQLAALPLPFNPLDPADPAWDLIAQALALGIPFDGQSVLPATSLALLVPGLVVTSLEPLELTPIADVAASGAEVLGRYQILVMNSTGQTWSLPNELSQYGEDDQGSPFLVEMPAD